MGISQVLCPVAGHSFAAAPAPQPPEFEEAWYVVTVQDPTSKEYMQCGHMHSVMKRVGDEVHTRTDTRIEMKRGAAGVEMAMQQESRETLDGRPLGFRHVMTMGNTPSTLSGDITGGTLTLVEEQFGTKHETTYDFDPEIKLAWGQYVEQVRHGLAPGTTYTVKSYEPSMRKDGPLETRFLVHGKEIIDVLGKQRNLCHITTSLKLEAAPQGLGGGTGGMTIDSQAWIDENAIPVVMTVDIGFMKMRMYRTSKADALERGAPPEMFLSTLVRTARRVGPGAARVKLRLRLKEGIKGKLPALPDTSMQTVRRVSEREAIVTLVRTDWKALSTATAAGTLPADIEAYLEASPECDANDAKIRRLARKAARDRKTPSEKADALRKYVTRYITNKNMNVGFATASEVARGRSGDCTEHGVLLAALARAAGLPARGVGGIVEIPAGAGISRDQGSFGYHMWTQVYIDGKWIDIDAALRQTDCDPTHVALTIIPLQGEGMMGSITSLIPLLGQLDMEVLEVVAKTGNAAKPKAKSRRLKTES